MPAYGPFPAVGAETLAEPPTRGHVTSLARVREYCGENHSVCAVHVAATEGPIPEMAARMRAAHPASSIVAANRRPFVGLIVVQWLASLHESRRCAA